MTDRVQINRDDLLRTGYPRLKRASASQEDCTAPRRGCLQGKHPDRTANRFPVGKGQNLKGLVQWTTD